MSLKTTHCPTCGTEHATSAIACPQCGHRDAGNWPKIGAIAAFVGLFAFAIVAGPIAMLAGWQTLEAGRRRLGWVLVGTGAGEFLWIALLYFGMPMVVVMV